MFRPNPRFESELESDSGVQERLLQAADYAKELAEQTAPRLTGRYADSFETVLDPRTGTARLLNTDWKAGLLEWGTASMAPFAVLRRAARAAGSKLKELPKQQ